VCDAVTLDMPRSLVFMSPMGRNLLGQCKGIGSDGTFGTCPITKSKESSPVQLYIVMAYVRNACLPVAWCYMERTTADDYKIIFDALFSGLLRRGWVPNFTITGRIGLVWSEVLM
jgi:hypothetical protein